MRYLLLVAFLFAGCTAENQAQKVIDNTPVPYPTKTTLEKFFEQADKYDQPVSVYHEAKYDFCIYKDGTIKRILNTDNMSFAEADDAFAQDDEYHLPNKVYWIICKSNFNTVTKQFDMDKDAEPYGYYIDKQHPNYWFVLKQGDKEYYTKRYYVRPCGYDFNTGLTEHKRYTCMTDIEKPRLGFTKDKK